MDMPETGSAFEAGQRPRVGFLRGGTFTSPFVTPFGCEDEAETVVDEELEGREVEEFDLCALLRGTNIQDSSSGLIAFKLTWLGPSLTHPFLG